MAELSITFEGLFGLTWPEWKLLVRNVEDLGFSALYLSDHFMLSEPPAYPSLEMVVALTYLADHTERVRFGPMVSPLSFREPVMLARQAAALDDLSGARMVLGLGTGHVELEHDMFGYDLGDMATRFARLEEGLEVITGLLRCEDPVSFDGEFFRLHEAVLPPPRRPGGPAIMIGGSGPRRTLPLVARFADVWNAQWVTTDELTERMSLLDRLLEQSGRRPEDVRRTMTMEVVCWRTPDEQEARLRRARRFPPLRDLSSQEILDTLRGWPSAVIGTPEQVVSQIRAFEAVGVSEIVLRWLDAEDIEGLEILASEVLPAFESSRT
jgi:alkanesulfonate monooxygenase SsuD/methylene tetrahydromethanopterin reductase-like flavin-dependent oxidoreductase (luciferase family)